MRTPSSRLWICALLLGCGGDDTAVSVVESPPSPAAAPALASIANRAPSVAEVTLSPAHLRPGHPAECRWSGFHDADGDADRSRVAWWIDDAPAGTAAQLPAAPALGRRVTCRVTPSDGVDDGVQKSASVVISNTPPSLADVRLELFSEAPLRWRCVGVGFVDPDGDPDASFIRWTLNGATLAAATGDTLQAGVPGDVISCEITPFDGYALGTPVAKTLTVGAPPPSLAAVAVTPTEPRADDVLACTWSGFDGDPDRSFVEWRVNGVEVGAGPTLAGGYVYQDRVTCSVTPYDGVSEGDRVHAEVVVQNTPPTIAAARIDPLAGGLLACGWDGFDDRDGHADASFVAWQIDEVTIWESPVIGFTPAADQRLRCVVTPFDGVDEGAAVYAVWPPPPSNTPPSLTGAVITPAEPRVGDMLNCMATGFTDLEGAADQTGFEWRVGDTVVGEGPTLAAGFVVGDTVTCVAHPYDGEMWGTPRSATVTVANTPPVVTSVVVTPAAPRRNDPLTCVWTVNDPDQPAPQSDQSVIQWRVDGVDAGTAAMFEGDFRGGEQVSCTVTPYDGVSSGVSMDAAVVVSNTAPTIDSVVVTPQLPRPDDTLSCVWTGFADLDGDVDASIRRWELDGVYAGDAETLAGPFDVGAFVVCNVEPHDGALAGPILGASVTIQPPEPVCGDGEINGTDICDDGLNDGAYGGCEPGCGARAAFCGDGTQNGPEACDDGENQGAYDGCQAGCMALGPYCGDGTLSSPEVCDDGVNSGKPGACEPGCDGLADGFTHGGWSDVVALGPKMNDAFEYVLADGTTSLNKEDSDQRVELQWSAFGGPTAEGYAVYRATAPDAQDFAAALAFIGDPSIRSYVDTTVVPGTIYYYVVRPRFGSISYPTDEPYSEIRVIAPPPNMALVHRWIANQEVCGLMPPANALTIDPLNHYRCAFTGQGTTAGFYDLGHDLLVDRFELGCAWTRAGVGFDAGSGTCFAAGVAANDADSATLGVMTSPAALQPPLAQVDQAQAARACAAHGATLSQQSSAVTLPKRLLSLKEARASAAWAATMSDAMIATLEDGEVEGGNGDCNTNRGHDDDGNPENAGMSSGVFRTGSTQATRSCVSRYGVQDMVGNVDEWVSDQCDWAGAVCIALGGIDPDNADLQGYLNVLGHQKPFTDAPWFSPALGLPLAVAEDGAIELALAGAGLLHDDWWDAHTDKPNGAAVGGHFLDRGARGRWSVELDRGLYDTRVSRGVRCGAAIVDCANATECPSGATCDAGICRAPSCFDGVQNQDEAGVDCGGVCGSACAIPIRGSCVAHRTAGVDVDGVYVIDPDGLGGDPPFNVYCDMTWQGGGWTLVFNHGVATGFDAAAAGSITATCFDSHCTNRAFSTVPITMGMMFDASDAPMTDQTYGARTTLLQMNPDLLENTLAELLGTHDVHVDLESNAGVDTDWQNGMSCGSVSNDDWGDWRKAVCQTEVITFNDVGDAGTCLDADVIGMDSTYNDGFENSCAGWPADPNWSLQNLWPDFFRVWVR